MSDQQKVIFDCSPFEPDYQVVTGLPITRTVESEDEIETARVRRTWRLLDTPPFPWYDAVMAMASPIATVVDRITSSLSPPPPDSESPAFGHYALEATPPAEIPYTDLPDEESDAPVFLFSIDPDRTVCFSANITPSVLNYLLSTLAEL